MQAGHTNWIPCVILDATAAHNDPQAVKTRNAMHGETDDF